MPIPKDFHSPTQITARERAYSQLQRWIIDGTLKPGEKLHDGELADALGVSRTPVREALQLLEVQGFVEMHRGRDTRVTAIDKSDILKLYPPLAALQSLACETVAPTIRIEQTDQLRRINVELSNAINYREFFRAMELDEQFHDLIVEMADNPYITGFISMLQLHIRRFKYVFLQQPVSSSEASVVEHAAIIDAFDRRDSSTAAEVVKQNWLRPMNELFKMI